MLYCLTRLESCACDQNSIFCSFKKSKDFSLLIGWNTLFGFSDQSRAITYFFICITNEQVCSFFISIFRSSFQVFRFCFYTLYNLITVCASIYR